MTTDKDAPNYFKDRKLVGWKAWYTDGSIYGSDKYTWEEIPQRHFMCVKRFWIPLDENGEVKDDVYGEHLSGQDIYVLDDEYRDRQALPDYIKIGEWQKDKDFHPLFDEMKADEEMILEMI
jgi:hypothetical protein